MRLTNDIKKQIVNSVMADTKTIDYLEQANALVRKYIVDGAPDVIREAYAHSPSVFIHASVYRDCAYLNYPVLYDEARRMAAEYKEVLPLLKQHAAQEHKGKEARRALESLLASCTTSGTLLAVAPELEKYISTDMPKKCLPVATDLKDKLKAAGWPKGGCK